MPRLKPSTQLEKRGKILDAAEQCFATRGFHRTTMQDICSTADVSPGALYGYFASKEDLIAGICARERENFDFRVAALAEAPDFFAALEKIATHYFVDTPLNKRRVCVEMGIEATRNATIREIHCGLEQSVTEAFHGLFQRLADDGRIAPDLPIAQVTAVFMVMGDGLFWRRATVEKYDAAAVIPALMRALHDLLKPVDSAGLAATAPSSRSRPKTPASQRPSTSQRKLAREAAR